jgi:tRNA-splicing ligase RtcB
MEIIPGSIGARSYIVRGKGNPESFMSCNHGAGRAMSRAEAKRRFTLDDHAKATPGVIDETPMAYKSIDAVMEAQRDLVDLVHTLRQPGYMCKGVRRSRKALSSKSGCRGAATDMPRGNIGGPSLRSGFRRPAQTQRKRPHVNFLPPRYHYCRSNRRAFFDLNCW